RVGGGVDEATLGRRVGSLENNDNLELLVDNPVLQLNQLTLQAKQFLEIKSPIDSLFSFMLVEQLGEPLVVELHFKFFVNAVEHFAVETVVEGALVFAVGAHIGTLSQAVVARS